MNIEIRFIIFHEGVSILRELGKVNPRLLSFTSSEAERLFDNKLTFGQFEGILSFPTGRIVNVFCPYNECLIYYMSEINNRIIICLS